jgi:hypothetical protein
MTTLDYCPMPTKQVNWLGKISFHGNLKIQSVLWLWPTSSILMPPKLHVTTSTSIDSSHPAIPSMQFHVINQWSHKKSHPEVCVLVCLPDMVYVLCAVRFSVWMFILESIWLWWYDRLFIIKYTNRSDGLWWKRWNSRTKIIFSWFLLLIPHTTNWSISNWHTAS